MAACCKLIHEGGSTRPSPSEQPIRVLLVEDDRDLRGALADLLRLERMDVAEAENGLEALLHLRTATPPPDLVLLDLGMPIMSGWEFREAQQRDPSIAGIPVILLSSHVANGLEAAATLVKPCRPEELLETIARVAGRAP